MPGELQGKKVAILLTEGVEQVEALEPKRALEEAGATTHIVAPEEGRVRAWNHTEWGDEIEVDVSLDRANPEDYDALVLPGGVMNPDKLRMDDRAVAFTRHFIDAGKPVASICHGPWMLIEADAVRGRTVTSYPSLRTDLRNAGAEWVDREVVVDRGVITSRKPADLEAFNRKLIEEIAKGRQEQRRAA